MVVFQMSPDIWNLIGHGAFSVSPRNTAWEDSNVERGVDCLTFCTLSL